MEKNTIAQRVAVILNDTVASAETFKFLNILPPMEKILPASAEEVQPALA